MLATDNARCAFPDVAASLGLALQARPIDVEFRLGQTRDIDVRRLRVPVPVLPIPDSMLRDRRAVHAALEWRQTQHLRSVQSIVAIAETGITQRVVACALIDDASAGSGCAARELSRTGIVGGARATQLPNTDFARCTATAGTSGRSRVVTSRQRTAGVGGSAAGAAHATHGSRAAGAALASSARATSGVCAAGARPAE